MFPIRQTDLDRVVLSAVAVLLLLTTAGQSAVLTDDLQTTAASLLSNTTTQLNTSADVEYPKVLRTFRSCAKKDDSYCENGGECMYPQDSDKPFCICPSSYEGIRCHFYSDATYSQPEMEQLIGISFGVVMLLVVLAVMIYCLINRRCKKSAPLIKSAPSETSV